MQRGTGLYRMFPAHGMTSWLKSHWLSKPARRLNNAHFHQRACAKARGLLRMQSLLTSCSTMLLCFPSGNTFTGLLMPLSSVFWSLAVLFLNSPGFCRVHCWIDFISFYYCWKTEGFRPKLLGSATQRLCPCVCLAWFLTDVSLSLGFSYNAVYWFLRLAGICVSALWDFLG